MMQDQQTTTAVPDPGHPMAHPHLLRSLEWRCIGPYRGGRVVAEAGDPVDAAVFYFGACAGGIWKSTDAGTTWTHLGLEDTRHIARVRIHPTNPDLVYVAALGHAYGPNNQRGV